MNVKKEPQEEQEHRSQAPTKSGPKGELEKQKAKALEARDTASDEATRTYWQRVADSLEYLLKYWKEEAALSAAD